MHDSADEVHAHFVIGKARDPLPSIPGRASDLAEHELELPKIESSKRQLLDRLSTPAKVFSASEVEDGLNYLENGWRSLLAGVFG